MIVYMVRYLLGLVFLAFDQVAGGAHPNALLRWATGESVELTPVYSS